MAVTGSNVRIVCAVKNLLGSVELVVFTTECSVPA